MLQQQPQHRKRRHGYFGGGAVADNFMISGGNENGSIRTLSSSIMNKSKSRTLSSSIPSPTSLSTTKPETTTTLSSSYPHIVMMMMDNHQQKHSESSTIRMKTTKTRSINTTTIRKELIPWIRTHCYRQRYTTLLITFFLGTIINAIISHHYLSYIMMYPNASTLRNGLYLSGRPLSGAYGTDKDNNNNNNPHQTYHDRTNQKLNDTHYHLVFSTGCSPYQDWQAYVFFFHVWKSGQIGNVTRIASCETRQDSKRLLAWHKEKIVSTMSDRFSLHITIDYSQRVTPGLRFYYFNKPFGLLNFMEHVLGYDDTASSTENPNDDTIILLLDPDQLLIRPFTNDFSPNSTEYWRPTRGNLTLRDKVSHGFPFAQQYGYGLQWKNKVNVTYVANGPTRITSMSIDEAWSHYAVGPPYIATARDMYAIARTWTQFVPRVLDLYPHLLAEMFAYSLAAAHLNMPHRVAQSFMVSDVKTTAEAWKLVHAMGKDNLCRETTTQSSEHHHPHVLHYCHNYNLGEWFIGKYRLSKDFISCDAPLLQEPPPDLPQYNYQLAPDGSHVTLRNRQAVERQAYMICTLIPKLNQAARFFKEHHCHGQANYIAIHLTQT